MFRIAQASLKSPREIAENMIALTVERERKGRSFAAYGYFQKALEQSDTCQMKAFCLLALGQLKEKQDDYAEAMGWYQKAFEMEPGKDSTWYLLNNNLGYCLNRLDRHAEGAEACRSAIRIDPDRHNAWKNLGIALGACRTESAAEVPTERPRRGIFRPVGFVVLQEVAGVPRRP
ncbi:MAG: tetratricopeptide repeat protein, partial [Spirochaetia bacterium]